MTETDLATARTLWRRRRQMIAVLRIAWRIVVAVLRGLRRGLRLWWRWVRARELDAAVKAASAAGAGPGSGLAGITADRYQRRHRRIRAGVSAAVLITVSVALLVVLLTFGVLLVGSVATLPTLAGTAGVARAGRKDGERVLTGPRKPGKVNQDKLTIALRDAGIIGKTANVTFKLPITKEVGAWSSVVDLPPGDKASDAVKRTEGLASALSIDESQLALARVRGPGGHAGRLSIWASETDPWATAPTPWPLANAERWDLWADDYTPAPFPFAVTARGTVVSARWLWSSMLIGSLPRMGKSAAGRIPVASALLNPYVDFELGDGKGGGDWDDLLDLVSRAVLGDDKPERAAFADLLESLVAEMRGRYRLLRSLPKDLRPEPKLNRILAEEHGMRAKLILIDEIQQYLVKSEQRTRIIDALATLLKVGPAIGYSVLVMTQKPDDVSLPPEIRDIFPGRFALRNANRDASDMVLGRGTGAPDTSKLRESDKGVGVPWGTGDDPSMPTTGQFARTYMIDGPMFRRIVARGIDLRRAAGAMPAAPEPATADRVVALVRAAGGKLPTRGILVGLGRLADDATDGEVRAAGVKLADELRPHGMRPVDLREGPKVVSGYRLDGPD